MYWVVKIDRERPPRLHKFVVGDRQFGTPLGSFLAGPKGGPASIKWTAAQLLLF
jgi:hypothetical protein